jgi:transposase
VSHKRKRYTSDLNDAQWERVCALLPLDRVGPGRPIEIDMREAVNAMLYVAKTGCQWENLYCGWIPGQIYAFNKGDSALAISAVSNSAGVT